MKARDISVPLWTRNVVLLAMVAAAAIGTFAFRDYLSFEALRENHEQLSSFRDANYLLCALVFVATYVLLVALSLPGASVATLTGGFLFGVFPGVFLNVIAAGTGAVLIFLAARFGLGERLAARMDASGGAIRRIKSGIAENQWSMLFLMRLVPAVPFFVANLIPALVGVRLFPYFVTTFLGILPGAFVYTTVGAGLGGILASDEKPNLGVIFEPQILWPIIGLCTLAALPIFLKLLRPRMK